MVILTYRLHFEPKMYLIKKATLKDKKLLLKMRMMLWPDTELAEHEKEIINMLKNKTSFGIFLAIRHDGSPIAFTEVGVRPYANGCKSKPVPFLEGIWVAEAYQHQGIGKKLIDAVVAWCRSKNFDELGSDTELYNQISIKAHLNWGFTETEKVVYFRKSLGKDGI